MLCGASGRHLCSVQGEGAPIVCGSRGVMLCGEREMYSCSVEVEGNTDVLWIKSRALILSRGRRGHWFSVEGKEGNRYLVR